jgi:hypothetical protein
MRYDWHFDVYCERVIMAIDHHHCNGAHLMITTLTYIPEPQIRTNLRVALPQRTFLPSNGMQN